MPHPQRHARAAFTLAEMLLATAIAAIVLSSLHSLILIAGRAVPEEQGVQIAAVDAGNGLERLVTELSVAVEILEISETSVSFSLNDWTGDGVVETVKYAWSGVAGDPLLRAVNGSAAAVLIPAVDRLKITATQTDKQVPVAVTITEVEDALVHEVNTLKGGTKDINYDKWLGQRIIPALPADSTAWQVKGVDVWLESTGDSGPDMFVELRGVDDATLMPNSVIYARATFSTAVLTSALQRFHVPLHCPKLPPDEDLTLVLRTDTPKNIAKAHFDDPPTPTGGRNGYRDDRQGTAWHVDGGKILASAIYADTWSRPSPEQTRKTLSELRIQLATGEPLQTMERRVRLLNRPEVVP